MTDTVNGSAGRAGSVCSVGRFFVGSAGQVWGDTTLMVAAILASAFLFRALRHNWDASAAGGLLVVAAALMGCLFLRQLARGERGWMFYSAMLVVAALPDGGEGLAKAGISPTWVAAAACLAATPAVMAIVGAVRIVKALDEMWRQINYRALAFAFVATLTLVLAQWFLASLGVEILTWRTLPLLMVVLWGAGTMWAYRLVK